MALSAHTILTDAPLSSRRSGGIDAARGTFALWVLIFAHLVPWTVYSMGADSVPDALDFLSSGLIRIFQSNAELHPAVLGFIVLSGYCIHHNGFRGERRGLRRFAVRRAFRILPIYFLALLSGVVGFHIANGIDPAKVFAITATREISTWCLIAKAISAPALFPSLMSCAYQGNGPLATVMVEIVLYAVYALAFPVLVWRGLAGWWFRLCGVVWLAGVVVAWGNFGIYSWWQNISLWGFLPYWWIGAAFVNRAFTLRVRQSLIPLLLAWSLLTILILFGSPMSPVLSEFRKLVFALLIGLAVVRLDNSYINSGNPLSTLGRAGYSLYAFHAPITYTLCIIGVPWWLNILSNLGVAGVAYRLVEAPFTRLGSRRAARGQLIAVTENSVA
jgi:peptidoglycan/LPS O-acetylase OafA/YrhL